MLKTDVPSVENEEIPNATLLTLEGTAHELHPNDWDTIIDAIINHTRRFEPLGLSRKVI